MAQVIVRNLEDSVVEVLKERAALRGHSLEQELRDTLTQAAKFTPRERRDFADKIRARARWISGTDSADLIREDRDSR